VKAIVEAIRENPSWARESKEFLKTAAWAFRYSEEVPTRNEIARALISAQHGRPRESA
jgi:hypothetical protein